MTASSRSQDAVDRHAQHNMGWRFSVLQKIDRLSLWHVTAISWVAWLLMCLALLGTPRDSIVGLTQIAESWGAVERVALWQDALSWVLPRYALPPGVIAYTIRASFIILFALQAIVFWRMLRTDKPSFWKWMIGPIGSHIIMFLMPPSNSDVFFYAMIGDLKANGINPYVHELQQFPDHPLLPYQHWIDIGTVYGPVWTTICSIIMRITGPDPVAAIVGFKVFGSLVAIAATGLAYYLARFLTRNQSLAVAAAMLVAWQPNMTFENSGQVHNDTTVMLLATTGIAMVIIGGLGALRAGIIVTTVSFTTKFVTLPLVGLLVLMRLVRSPGEQFNVRRLITQWTLDAIAIIGVVLAAFLPYWEGTITIHEMLAEPGRLFAHPVWRVGEAALQMLPTETAVNVYRTVLRYGMQALTFTVFGYVTWHFIRVMWTRQSSGLLKLPTDAPRQTSLEYRPIEWWTRPLLVAWTIVVITLSMLPVNAHPWYWTWPIIPVALLVTIDLRSVPPEERSSHLPRWFTWYLIATAVMTLMYHTRIARYG